MTLLVVNSCPSKLGAAIDCLMTPAVAVAAPPAGAPAAECSFTATYTSYSPGGTANARRSRCGAPATPGGTSVKNRSSKAYDDAASAVFLSFFLSFLSDDGGGGATAGEPLATTRM